jgi:hypothetical protein
VCESNNNEVPLLYYNLFIICYKRIEKITFGGQ